MDATDVLPAMVGRIVSQFAPEQVILFGSHARGDAGPDSDLDLIVVMGDEATDRRRTAIAIRVALADAPCALDIIVTTPAELARRREVTGSVFRPAMAEGQVVYERA
jgi:predicted nucleotidyltransferase